MCQGIGGAPVSNLASRYQASRRFLCAVPAGQYVSEIIDSVDEMRHGVCPQEI